jgi:hypothetical protein
MTRNDLLTGEKFTPKRITQKFACSENRTRYHNSRANKLRHSLRYVNAPLQQNFKILSELMEGKTEQKFHKQFLLGKGYSFNVFTHYHPLESKNVPCIYFYAISLVENDIITITTIKG